MSWYCDLYAEVNNGTGWKRIGTGSFYRSIDTLLGKLNDGDGDPCTMDLMQELKYADLSPELQKDYSEAPAQYFYMSCRIGDMIQMARESIEKFEDQELVLFRASGVKCSRSNGLFDSLDLDFDSFDEHFTKGLTHPIGAEILVDFNRALNKYGKAVKLLGVLETIQDMASPRELNSNLRLVFVRSL